LNFKNPKALWLYLSDVKVQTLMKEAFLPNKDTIQRWYDDKNAGKPRFITAFCNYVNASTTKKDIENFCSANSVKLLTCRPLSESGVSKDDRFKKF